MREKLKDKKEKEPLLIADVLETYGIATLISGVLGGMYFLLLKPGFSLTLAAIANGFCFVCLLFILAWLGHFALGSMKDPESFENLEPPDPANLHKFRIKLARILAPYIPKK